MICQLLKVEGSVFAKLMNCERTASVALGGMDLCGNCADVYREMLKDPNPKWAPLFRKKLKARK